MKTSKRRRMMTEKHKADGLKMGDIIQIEYPRNNWENRIFIKEGQNDGVIAVREPCRSFFNGGRFDTCFWTKDEWRRKPEPKYVPFKWEDRNQLRDRWIRHKINNKKEFRISVIKEEYDIMMIEVSFDRLRAFSAGVLLEDYVFADTGLPVGKLVS
jgi:hypothetical protein